MKNHATLWMLLAGAAILLIAGHGVILSWVSSQMALSMAAIAGLITVVIIVHRSAGLRNSESNAVGRRGLHFVVATVPCT